MPHVTQLLRRVLITATLISSFLIFASPDAKSQEGDSSSNNRSRPDSYILPGETVFPEGIAYQPLTGDFFVSSTTDGTIFKGNVRRRRARVFLTGGENGRTTAIGLKVDGEGRLFIAGGATGLISVYNTTNRNLIGKFETGLGAGGFINDVALTRCGDAYFTDSRSPFLYRVSSNEAGRLQFERFIDFTGTAFVYQAGNNANGIAASPDNRFLIIIQSNTGKLFRVEIATKAVIEIDTGGASLTNGDGILLQGRTLYVVRNQQGRIATLRLSEDLTRGSLVSESGDPSFAFPTTAAIAKGRLLVVNSQFNRRGPGLSPQLPFTVSSVPPPSSGAGN